METTTIADKMKGIQKKFDYCLPKKSYTMIMLDGKNFSRKVKKRFKRPFDDVFVKLMDDTAAFLCKELQGAKFAFVQSDEISIVLTDFEAEECSSFFDNRLCKLQSISASLATSFFNREVVNNIIADCACKDEITSRIKTEPLYQFDAKAWSIPADDFNDMFCWFLFRQNDCIRNSRQQVAQTYLSHKTLVNKNTDEQIQLLKDECGIDWNNDFEDNVKFGRFVYKETVLQTTMVKGEEIEFNRSVWLSHPAFRLSSPEGRRKFISLGIVPMTEIALELENSRNIVN